VNTKQFTKHELEKMLSDPLACQLGKQEEVSAQNGKALLKNTIKQLLSILNTGTSGEAKPDHVTAV
jgi:hypothetical protein